MPRRRKRRGKRRSRRKGARSDASFAPAPKRRRVSPDREKKYLSTDPYVLNHPLIVPLLARLRSIVPSETRPRWDLRPAVWTAYLAGHPDREFAARVVRNNTEGWPTTRTTAWEGTGDCEEYRATVEEIASGLEKVLRRADIGYLWGPFPTLESTPFNILEIMVHELFYKHELDKIRSLLNMSCQCRGKSLNEQISDDDKWVRYVRVLEIVERIVKCGLKYLWCADAYEAYCRVPLETRMIPLLGFRICGYYFFYTCLVMGYSPSSRVYTEFGDALQWICVHRDPSLFRQEVDGEWFDLLLHYLDGL